MAKTILNKKGVIYLIFFMGITSAIQAFGLSTAKKPIHLVPSIVSKHPKEEGILQQQANRELVVLIHGLMRTSLSMWPLKLYLKKQGYDVYSYSYPSMKYNIREHGIYLEQFIKTLLIQNPKVKINFITHSLGGIITREALSKLSKKQLARIGCLIMLAPPNQGARLAKLSSKMFPVLTSSIKPLAELSSDPNSYVHSVPVPDIKIGIIAGQYDMKVPPDMARLGQNNPMIVNSTHTFIMNNKKTKQLIMNFLKKGSFSEFPEQSYPNNNNLVRRIVS